MDVVIELAGPDRVGKSSLREAITKRYEQAGLDNRAYTLVRDRGVFDCIALDRYFGRENKQVTQARFEFLIAASDYYLPICLLADEKLLTERQQQQIDAGLLDGVTWNQQIIDFNKMVPIYKKLCLEYDEYCNEYCKCKNVELNRKLMTFIVDDKHDYATYIADLLYTTSHLTV